MQTIAPDMSANKGAQSVVNNPVAGSEAQHDKVNAESTAAVVESLECNKGKIRKCSLAILNGIKVLSIAI